MNYLGIVLIVLVIVVVNLLVIVYAYARTRDKMPDVKDQVVGFLLGGPIYYWIEQDLRRRGHKLTLFERVGLIAIGLIVMVLVVGSIVTNYTKYPF